MENHFGKGLMAGLRASHAASAASAARFCADYRRGFVLGYAHHLSELTGDGQRAAWEAGILTRRYNLDKDLVVDFFKDRNAGSAVHCFMAGYNREG
ncbi:DUF2623 family protein [Entomohabitans teleogrylli]|uniref:DUF2623 family protein n=1 Tax=Entomohabitans teleogrylli TaxID=1384589 RepID=UPI00073DB680|nr:DUF2623 family protein [Entomohabitans teleogrylli]